MDSATPTPPSQGVPSQYGRACTGCVRAKCRCVYRSEGGGCERCHRLRRECTPSVSVRKRKFDASNTPRRRRLEDKLDDLVTVLRARASSNAQDPVPQAPAAPPGVHGVPTPATLDDSAGAHEPPNCNRSTSHGLSAAHGPLGPNRSTPYGLSAAHEPETFGITASGGSAGVHGNTDPHTATSHPNIVVDVDTGTAGFVPQAGWMGATSSERTPSVVTDCVRALNISEDAADEQLRHFRTAFLPHFAVFHIPANTSSAALRQERPFLWLVIMSLTAPSLATQTKLGDAIRRIIMQQVMMDEERSLDLLLGLLCFNAWSYCHKKERSPIIIWSQLAASVAFDLGIHRDVPRENHQLRTQRAPPRQRRTLTERRAFLATYLVTSGTWLMFGKMEPVRRTTYLDDCMKMLTNERESDLDGQLVTNVKCHLIMDQITLCLSNRAQRSETPEGIPLYLVRALEAQLQELRINMPPELLQSRAASLCLARAEVVVKSAHLHTSSHQTTSTLPDFERLQNLGFIVTAIQSWLHLWNDIQPSELTGLTTSALGQLGHCVMLLFKLTTLHEPGWDTEDLKRRVNCLDVLEDAARKMEGLTTGKGAGEEGGDGGPVVTKGPALLRALKDVLAGELAKAGTHAGVGSVRGEAAMCEPFLSSDVLTDFAMEPWVDEMLATSL